MDNRDTQEQMFEDATAELRNSGLFASAEALAELFGEDRGESAARISEWNARGAIFSMEDAGAERFPVFVFESGDDVRPYPQLQR